MASDLSGKRIIVTGAATGIGRATTLRGRGGIPVPFPNRMFTDPLWFAPSHHPSTNPFISAPSRAGNDCRLHRTCLETPSSRGLEHS